MAQTLEVARFAAVLTPLRRALLTAARTAADLPHIPDAQVEIIRALPRGTVMASGALADTLGLSRPTVSNLLNHMETAGLIERRPVAHDRRRVEVLASERALQLFERFDHAADEIVEKVSGALDEDEIRAFNNVIPLLERLRDALVEHPTDHDRKEAE